LKELPELGINFFTHLVDDILRTDYFPLQWKMAQIIMISKPNKNPIEVRSCRQVSLLPIISKLFEKLFLQKLMPVITEKRLISNHQFGFHSKYTTVEQTHKITNKITLVFEAEKYCSAVFLEVSQAFDKIWHDGFGILFKIQ